MKQGEKKGPHSKCNGSKRARAVFSKGARVDSALPRRGTVRGGASKEHG